MKIFISEQEKRSILQLYEQTSSSNVFKITKDGITDYVVVNIPNQDVKTIYEKILKWAYETLKNPNEEIKAKILNDKIIISSIYNFKVPAIMGGEVTVNLNYRIIISIKDSKYKIEVPELIFVGGPDGPYDFKQHISEYFKSDGTPKSKRLGSVVDSVEKFLNALNSNIEKFINAPLQSEEW